MSNIDEFNYEIPGVADAYKPLPDRMREEREAAARAAKLDTVAKAVVEEVLEAPAPKKPTVPAKSKAPVELAFTLGQLKEFAGLSAALVCQDEGCDMECASAITPTSFNALTEGRVGWKFVLLKDNSLAAYCFRHKPPRKSQPFRFQEKRNV